MALVMSFLHKVKILEMTKLEASHKTSGMVSSLVVRGYLAIFPKKLGKKVVMMKAGRPRFPRYVDSRSGCCRGLSEDVVSDMAETALLFDMISEVLGEQQMRSWYPARVGGVGVNARKVELDVAYIHRGEIECGLKADINLKSEEGLIQVAAA
jgi:hypothetical protein